ncbi:MAG: hypothetical protein JXA75_03135 [Candidatus Thermoplasmatota archaeon]|nr:hypothetical protein [Candidatus Thermoplasmatota archaeon]
MQVTLLRCRRCHEDKSLDEFHRGFFQKEGYDVYCHDCRMEMDRKSRMLSEKQCRQCGRTKPISGFGRNASTRDGFYKECLECQEKNQHRRRERVAKGSWKGEMDTCTYCGMLKPTYELAEARYHTAWGKARYCRSCIALMTNKTIQEYEEAREAHGWAIQKRCNGCGHLLPSDRFTLNRRSKDGFSDLCITCTIERHNRWVERINARRKTQIIKSKALKECSICHTLKPLSSFSKNKSTLDGHSQLCTSCVIKVREENATVWSLERKEKGVMVREQRCSVCGRVLPISMFSRDRERKSGYYEVCKACYRKKERAVFSRWEKQRKEAAFEFSLDTVTEKVCLSCGRVLPLSGFWRRKASKDGYNPKCIECLTRKDKERKQKIKQQGFPEERLPLEKQCRQCLRILPRASFRRNCLSPDGLDSYCKDCRDVYYKEYKARPEVKQRAREYAHRPEVREKKRVRARVYQARPEVKERVRVYKREYKKRPYVREKRRAYDRMRYQQPAVKQKKKERDSRPEAKARRRRSTRAWQMRKKQEKQLSDDNPLL